MKSNILLLAAAVCALAAPACAQADKPERPVVAVAGSATIEHAPDWVMLTMQARGEGKTRVEALKALETSRHDVEAGLSALAGVQAVAVTTDEIKIADVRSDACKEDEDYSSRPKLSTGACAVVGAVATLNLTAKIAPASEMGDAASLATQLGALNVRIGGSGGNDPAALKTEAMMKAMEDARAQARTLAAGAGARLGPMLRLQDSRVDLDLPERRTGRATVTEVVVTASRIRPQVHLGMTPPPVRVEASVTAIYALDQ